MDDLDLVVKDSPDDQEMQRMAEEEQQQLHQQVCPALHLSSSEAA